MNTPPLKTLFAAKAWADDELFATLSSIDPTRQGSEMQAALRILNHIHVVDAIFKAHLSGEVPSHTATNTAETPTAADLGERVHALDAWYVAYVDGLGAKTLQEPIRFVFTDGDRGLMTREEILLHLLTHGSYHRGAVGQILRGAGTAPPRDLYTRFLHLREPERRA